MRISELLTAIASWLESPDNEAILLAEYDDDCLKIVAESCVQAAALLKVTAETVEDIEPPEESNLTPEAIQELGDLATALDESGDESLRKQASVIDELLLTIASPPNALVERQDLIDKRLDELKKKYEQTGKDLADTNKIADSLKQIDKSNMTKEMKIMEAPLSSRYCPDHPGAQVSRVGEHMWQCELDKKTYNFETGFTLNNGTKVPGGDVANQTQALNVPYYAIFDTRDTRMGQNS
jgi:hypothetical protein